MCKLLTGTACVHTYTLTGGTSPSICSSSSSEVGARAAVLLSTLRPPALRAILSLLLSTSVSPWLHSDSPGVRQNDDSVDTRTRRLCFNLWRLWEAPRLGWEGCRKRGLMKHGDCGLDDQFTDTVGGPLGGPGEAWELQNSKRSTNIRWFIMETSISAYSVKTNTSHSVLFYSPKACIILLFMIFCVLFCSTQSCSIPFYCTVCYSIYTIRLYSVLFSFGFLLFYSIQLFSIQTYFTFFYSIHSSFQVNSIL